MVGAVAGSGARHPRKEHPGSLQCHEYLPEDLRALWLVRGLCSKNDNRMGWHNGRCRHSAAAKCPEVLRGEHHARWWWRRIQRHYTQQSRKLPGQQLGPGPVQSESSTRDSARQCVARRDAELAHEWDAAAAEPLADARG